jgi:hypothetical protein
VVVATTCAKNAACFTASLPCDNCCATGRNLQGVACFDSVYTADACCNSPNPAITAAGATRAPTMFLCAKDPSCFDNQNPCDACCATDRNPFGCVHALAIWSACRSRPMHTCRYSCWDGRFTRDRCCNTRINVPACAVGRSGGVSDAVKLAAVQVGDAQCAAVTALGCCAADILAMESTLVFDGFPQTMAPTQVGRPFEP